MPKISIIIPVYNCEDTIHHTIEGLKKQSFTDFELILVNDGSIDNSGLVCDVYARSDSRFKVIHKQNGGAGSARNAGIECAVGDYLAFPDADDTAEPCMLADMYEQITHGNYDLVICGYFTHGKVKGSEGIVAFKYARLDNQDDLRRYFAEYFPEGMIGYPWNKLYRRDIITKHKLRFPDMRRYQDGMFNLEYFKHINSLVMLDKPYYHYQVNDVANIFAKSPKNIAKLCEEMAQEYYKLLQQWQLPFEDYDLNMRKFLINSLAFQIESSFSPRWQFKNKQRQEYAKSITLYDKTAYALNNISDIKMNRYVSKLALLLKNKQYNKAVQLVKIKLILKTKLRPVFEILKGGRVR